MRLLLAVHVPTADYTPRPGYEAELEAMLFAVASGAGTAYVPVQDPNHMTGDDPRDWPSAKGPRRADE